MPLPDRLFPGGQRRREDETDRDVAQICPNGHVINECLQLVPEQNQTFCATCGEKTLTECRNCNKPIPGSRSIGKYRLPAYCITCGAAYPWTERRTQAAIDLFAEEVTDADERARFEQSIRDAGRDTPAAQLATSRLKKALLKLGPVAAEQMRKLLAEIVSETIKKTLFPGTPPSSAGPH